MTQLDTIVSVEITAATKAVTKPSFAIPLLVAITDPDWTGDDVVRAYTSAASLLTDGFVTSDPEYLAALALTSQDISPALFLVGLRSATTGSVDAFTIGAVVAETEYHIGINGTEVAFTPSGTGMSAMLQGLLDAALADEDVGPLLDGDLSEVEDLGGGAFRLKLVAITGTLTFTVFSQFTKTHLADPHDVSTDLAAIQAQNDTWYGFYVIAASETEIETAAVWTEGQKKLLFIRSFDAAIGTGATTDLFSRLKTAAYKRTVPCFVNDSRQPAAWMGGQLPETPGSNNWAFKALNGITADALTDSQVANVIGVPVEGVKGKNGNVYTALGGINMTRMGTVASGEYIDNVIGIDWLHAEIQTRVFSNLANARKVPYTNAGVAILISAVKAALDQGATNGLLDPGSLSVTAADVLTMSTNDRANRIAPTIDFAARLQGAFNSVVVRGTVSV